MRDLSKKSVDAANEVLKDEELELLKRDIGRLERLRPQFSSNAQDFEALLQAVKISTRNYENVAQLRDRLTALGGGVLAVVRKAITLV